MHNFIGSTYNGNILDIAGNSTGIGNVTLDDGSQVDLYLHGISGEDSSDSTNHGLYFSGPSQLLLKGSTLVIKLLMMDNLHRKLI